MFEQIRQQSDSILPINWEDMQERWEKARQAVATLPIPRTPGREFDKVESHFISGEKHALKSYEMPLGDTFGFETRLYYSVCSECGVVWNKRVVFFNNMPPSAFTHWLVRKGKAEDKFSQSVQEAML